MYCFQYLGVQDWFNGLQVIHLFEQKGMHLWGKKFSSNFVLFGKKIIFNFQNNEIIHFLNIYQAEIFCKEHKLN